tara:strand:+ start:5889 stop:6137 length:249 start_codon:yes stop_codon:yes gene_type:complete
MKKVDVRQQIYEMRLPELIAQALSKKLDKPYDEIVKLMQERLDKKIDEVENNLSVIGNAKDISIDNPQDLDDFLKDKKVIKG